MRDGGTGPATTGSSHPRGSDRGRSSGRNASPGRPGRLLVSTTEQSEYASTEDDERARLVEAREGDVEGALATWRQRIAAHHDAKLRRRLPGRRVIASCRRDPEADWCEIERPGVADAG